MTKEEIIDLYKLQPHPEGGWYREVYRAEEQVERESTQVEPRLRSAATAIYYLLDSKTQAAWHRLSCDEMWIHVHGSELQLRTIVDEKVHLNNVSPAMQGAHSFVVPGSTWFRAMCSQPNTYALVMCVVAPGFDFEDFEMISPQELSSMFPELTNEIHEGLTVLRKNSE